MNWSVSPSEVVVVIVIVFYGVANSAYPWTIPLLYFGLHSRAICTSGWFECAEQGIHLIVLLVYVCRAGLLGEEPVIKISASSHACPALLY